MAKYYVRSGKVREVLHRPTREEAAYKVIHGYARSGGGEFLPLHALHDLGLVTAVSERGFRDRAATSYPTEMILREVGPFAREEEE